MKNKILLIGRHFRKLYSHLSVPLLIRYSLTQMELDIIAFLSNNPTKNTAKDIVEERMLTKSNVSSGVESLVSKGLLNKLSDKEDKRLIHLFLTKDTTKIVKDIRDMQNKFNELLLENFSDLEKEEISAYFNRIIDNIQNNLGGNDARK